ncbi:MAG: DUF1844 domain-containing protein [Planctomycetota bacterium]|jgi:hypothetical protein
MAEDEKKEKKIIVDEDWKAQAQKEKDILTAKEKAEQEDKEQEKKRPPLPGADFAGLVNMFTTQAFYAMGILRTKDDKDVPADLELAKYNIDMLDVLAEKTSGNVTEEEKKLLEDTLHQLRMAFVQVSQKQGA